MAVEIERKYLVTSDAWRTSATARIPIVQAYVAFGGACLVRVRRTADTAFITVKGARTGPSRVEIETEVPVGFADELLASGLCETTAIVKARHLVPVAGVVFEVDVFEGDNEGLVVAEVELDSEDAYVPAPPWLGPEVTGDPRYSNSALTDHPYREWGDESYGVAAM